MWKIRRLLRLHAQISLLSATFGLPVLSCACSLASMPPAFAATLGHRRPSAAGHTITELRLLLGP